MEFDTANNLMQDTYIKSKMCGWMSRSIWTWHKLMDVQKGGSSVVQATGVNLGTYFQFFLKKAGGNSIHCCSVEE